MKFFLILIIRLCLAVILFMECDNKQQELGLFHQTAGYLLLLLNVFELSFGNIIYLLHHPRNMFYFLPSLSHALSVSW